VERHIWAACKRPARLASKTQTILTISKCMYFMRNIDILNRTTAHGRRRRLSEGRDRCTRHYL